MTRIMQWIALACVLLLSTPAWTDAQEKKSSGQQAQSVEQSLESSGSFQQQLELEKLRSERASQNMEAGYKAAKYYSLLALIAFALTMLVIFAVITLIFFARARRERRRHELIGQYLEKGQEVPRELLSGRTTGAVLSPEQWAAFIRWRDLRRGTWFLCLGLGIGLVIYLWFGNLKYTVWCLIILFMSVAFYINALFFSGRSDFNRKQESES